MLFRLPRKERKREGEMYKGKAYNIFLCYRGKVDLQGGVFGSRIYDQLSKIDEFEPFFAPEVVDSGDNFMTASRQASKM